MDGMALTQWAHIDRYQMYVVTLMVKGDMHYIIVGLVYKTLACLLGT